MTKNVEVIKKSFVRKTALKEIKYIFTVKQKQNM